MTIATVSSVDDSSADTRLLLRLFANGASLQLLSIISGSPKRLLSSLRPWLHHAMRASVRGTSYVMMRLCYNVLHSLKLFANWQKRWVASLIGGYTTPPFFCSLLLVRSIYSRLLRDRVPDSFLWLLVVAACNYHLSSQSHHISSAYLDVNLRGVGLTDFECILHRSRTREVLPCCSARGTHPGEPSCVKAAVLALRRGTTHLAGIYTTIYLAKALFARRRFSSLSEFCLAYLRSLFVIVVQVHVARAALCVQSRCFPGSFKPWLCSVIACLGAPVVLLETPANRTEMVLFHSANLLNTQLSVMGLQSSSPLVSAMQFAAGSALYSDGGMFERSGNHVGKFP